MPRKPVILIGVRSKADLGNREVVSRLWEAGYTQVAEDIRDGNTLAFDMAQWPERGDALDHFDKGSAVVAAHLYYDDTDTRRGFFYNKRNNEIVDEARRAGIPLFLFGDFPYRAKGLEQVESGFRVAEPNPKLDPKLEVEIVRAVAKMYQHVPQARGVKRSKKEAVVACGSALTCWGLNDAIRDLDVFVPGMQVQRFEAPRDTFGPFEIDAWSEWRSPHHEQQLYDRAVAMGDVWVAHPRAIIDFYEELNREKDREKLRKLRKIATRVNSRKIETRVALPNTAPTESEHYGPKSGRFPPLQLPTRKRQSLDAAGDSVKEITAAWHARNQVTALSPQGDRPRVRELADDPELMRWVTPRLTTLGYQLGRRRGSGVFGTVYELQTLDGTTAPLVAKFTYDANEVATAHRLLQSGVQSVALPEVVGAWGGLPHGLWLIIREDVTKTCRDRPGSLCAVLDNISDLDPSLFWSEREPGGQGLQDFAMLNLRDKGMIKRFLKELRRIKEIAKVSFIDMHDENVRLRDVFDGPKHLVVTDFGMSSGPATVVPIAANPRSTLLFSYGSNSPRQLEARLGHPVVGQPAFIDGYGRAFRGYSQRWAGGVATLIPLAKTQTYGFVTEVSGSDLAVLDRYEGVASGNYARASVTVMVNGKKRPALVYLATSREKNAPSPAYLDAIVETISSFWSQGRPMRRSDITIR
jgi:cation transport regulator ChaC